MRLATKENKSLAEKKRLEWLLAELMDGYSAVGKHILLFRSSFELKFSLILSLRLSTPRVSGLYRSCSSFIRMPLVSNPMEILSQLQ